ncbi:insulinase family protein [Patescibacteria group bacterium]|nr:insulinase family protein [Patescibacteria group bacterium]MBU2035915.1 insulinase family protein [Patescibacteria group bacterium]
MPLTNTDSSIVMATVKAGPRFDPIEKEGLSHFTEHMLFRGTKKYPSRIKLAEVLEKSGAQADAFSYYETNKYWIKSSKEDIAVATDNLAERIYASLIKKEDIETEKGVVKEEKAILFSNPEKLIWEIWNQTLWKGEGLGRVYIGNEKSIDSFTRNDVLSFIKNNYIHNNIVYFVGGNINIEKVSEKLNLFSTNTVFDQDEPDSKISNFQPVRGQNINIFRNNSKVITIALGFRTIPQNHESKTVLELISTFLGGGMSSKLKQKIMEPGYTYSIQSTTENLSDTGYLVINLTTSKNLVKKVLKIIYSVISELTQKPLKVQELELIKGFYTGQLKINNETAQDWSFYYSNQAIYSPDKMETLEEKVNRVNKINSDKILQISKEFFRKDNFYLAAIGNIKEKEIINF